MGTGYDHERVDGYVLRQHRAVVASEVCLSLVTSAGHTTHNKDSRGED